MHSVKTGYVFRLGDVKRENAPAAERGREPLPGNTRIALGASSMRNPTHHSCIWCSVATCQVTRAIDVQDAGADLLDDVAETIVALQWLLGDDVEGATARDDRAGETHLTVLVDDEVADMEHLAHGRTRLASSLTSSFSSAMVADADASSSIRSRAIDHS